MKFDIETIFIILLLSFLIYNYYNGNCYNLIDYNMNNVFIEDSNRYYKNRDRFTGFPTEPKLPKAQSSFIKYPNILLEGLDNKLDNDVTLPHVELLNDRYNPLITNYADSQLQNIVITSSEQGVESDNYNDLLIDNVQKNMLLDMDSKLYKKSQRNQKLAKDSKTIASNFGRNALIETYKNELDFYQKEKSPWWEENID